MFSPDSSQNFSQTKSGLSPTRLSWPARCHWALKAGTNSLSPSKIRRAAGNFKRAAARGFAEKRGTAKVQFS
jgi:hypothetical protein